MDTYLALHGGTPDKKATKRPAPSITSAGTIAAGLQRVFRESEIEELVEKTHGTSQ